MRLTLTAAMAWMAAGPAQAAATPHIIYSADTTARVVALTFDDGPSPYTSRVLAILNTHRIKATFFLIGDQVAAGASEVRAEVADGEGIGNHTYTHADLSKLSGNDAAVDAQVRRTQTAIEAAAHVVPHWFRSPYGAIDGAVASYINSLGMGIVHWSDDPEDWSRPGTSAIVQRVMAQVKPGAIILLHDGGGDRSQTIAALPTILGDLVARGYSVLPLDALLGYKHVRTASPTPVPAGSVQATPRPTPTQPTQTSSEARPPVFLTDTDSPAHPATRFGGGVPRLYCWVQNAALPSGADSIAYLWRMEPSGAVLDDFSVAAADGRYTYGYIDATHEASGSYSCSASAGGKPIGAARFTIAP